MKRVVCIMLLVMLLVGCGHSTETDRILQSDDIEEDSKIEILQEENNSIHDTIQSNSISLADSDDSTDDILGVGKDPRDEVDGNVLSDEVTWLNPENAYDLPIDHIRLINRIIRGEFDNTSNENRDTEEMRRVILKRKDAEWYLCDADGDDVAELFFTEPAKKNVWKTVIGEFELANNGHCSCWDTGDFTSYEALTIYGRTFNVEDTDNRHCIFGGYIDDSGIYTSIYSEHIIIKDEEDFERYRVWAEENNIELKLGDHIYYELRQDGESRLITKEEFIKYFETMSGLDYEVVRARVEG